MGIPHINSNIAKLDLKEIPPKAGLPPTLLNPPHNPSLLARVGLEKSPIFYAGGVSVCRPRLHAVLVECKQIGSKAGPKGIEFHLQRKNLGLLGL